MLALLFAAALAEPPPGPHAWQAAAPPPPPPSTGPVLPPGRRPSSTVYGYHAYWTGSPLDIDFSRLTHVAVFNVELAADGSLSATSRWTDVAGDLVPLAHGYGTKVHLCVTSFDDSVTNAVLSSASRREAAASALQALVEDYGADGVNVDIEGLDASQRDNMTAFVAELAAAVGEVYVATPAIDWSDAYDYAALAAASDGLFIMGYDYHWGGGDPGPIAPLRGGSPWSDHALDWTVADYRSTGVPDDKLVLGLPLYGRQWSTDSSDVPGTSTGSSTAFLMYSALEEATARGSLYDTVTSTPYILEDDSQLWFDDIASVRDRIAYGIDEGLQGVGFWALQYEGDPATFWAMVSEETAPPGDTGGGGNDNVAPVALAGLPILAYPGDTVILDGSPSYDEDGTIAAYAWTLDAGPEATIERADTPRPRMTVPAAGVYTVRLTVTDDGQATGEDTMSVIVADPAAGERYGGCAAAPLVGVWWIGVVGVLARRRDG